MKKTPLLKKTELTKALHKLPKWSLNPKATMLSYTAAFETHIDALVFVARVTVHAQVLDHHPDILFTYKKVKVTLSTHDVKGITKKDIELASRISNISNGG